MSETALTGVPLATRFPRLDEALPMSIDLLDQHNRQELVEAPGLGPIPNSELANNFEKEAQAARLHNEVLEIAQIKDPLQAQMELSLLDSRLQALLGKIMYQCGKTWGLYCGAIAFTIG